MSFKLDDSVMEINEDEVKAVLNSKRCIWKNKTLVKLVEDFLETNMETLDLCDSVMTCLKRVRETRLLILEALHHFDDEDRANESSYEKTLDNLKNFKAAGDPFTQDFFRIFNFVYRRQIAFLEKLRRKKLKLFKLLDLTRVYFLLKNIRNSVNAQKEVIHIMEIGSYKAMQDIQKIRTCVYRLEIGFESFMMNTDFAISSEVPVRIVMDHIKRTLTSFPKNVDELGMMANLCTANIQKARRVLFQRIIRPPRGN
ncbi:hypothetical protein HanRHA438_Chr16g0753941 [Helianthus annuus]|nr:hypothetical protein HanIR_Chr16g0806641 [Helianthus annuus]KAJ0644404.1 hypothetical protein HanOQP8_Chr16g0611721 [Helianthus annuus]KAJ0820731.1 hypothetical protein HanPSC8_Chr16g0711521 [Helianthus annuus]KAJ0835324.1 hypothetical protein HanRHA438_Chr16g0753941 [Helianthus annuus]